MNKKGFELATSTIVLIIIGMFVLIGLILFFRNSIGDFEDGTGTFLENSEAILVREACELACEAGNGFAFCCGNKTVQGQQVRCDDPRLDLSCDEISCAAVSCFVG